MTDKVYVLRVYVQFSFASRTKETNTNNLNLVWVVSRMRGRVLCHSQILMYWSPFKIPSQQENTCAFFCRFELGTHTSLVSKDFILQQTGHTYVKKMVHNFEFNTNTYTSKNRREFEMSLFPFGCLRKGHKRQKRTMSADFRKGGQTPGKPPCVTPPFAAARSYFGNHFGRGGSPIHDGN